MEFYVFREELQGGFLHVVNHFFGQRSVNLSDDLLGHSRGTRGGGIRKNEVTYIFSKLFPSVRPSRVVEKPLNLCFKTVERTCYKPSKGPKRIIYPDRIVNFFLNLTTPIALYKKPLPET